MAYETILYECEEPGIGVLSLNRPRRLNMVNYKMMEELEHFWRERKEDLATHVVVLKGMGEKAFCAGLDMKEAMTLLDDKDTDRFYQFQSRLGRLLLAMRRAPQPILCAVHGAAVGLGFSFALASDARIITHDTRFSAAYINIGLGGADMGCSYFLPRLIGGGRAHEFMLTGNFMGADDAFSLGLVSRVEERSQLVGAALEMARIMNAKNPMGLRLTKEAINTNLDAGGLEQALHVEDRNQSLLVTRGWIGKKPKTSKYF